MVQLPLSGGCACGFLRYELSQAPLMIYNCHCSNCQKISGGAFNTAAGVPEGGIRFSAGDPARVEWNADSGRRRFGWFCSACGSRIANGAVPSNGVLSLRTGTLDNVSWIQPVGDTFTSSAQPWVRFVDNGLQSQRAPESYAPFIAAFAALGLF